MKKRLRFRKITLYCDYILNYFTSALKKTCKVRKGRAPCRNPFTLLPKHFSKPHRAEMHQFSLILTIKHHVPTGTVSSSIPYMPKTTSQSQPQTQRNLGPPLTLHMLILHFLKLFSKTYDMKYTYAQTVIKIQVHYVSGKICICQIAKPFHPCNALRFT